jgi:MYXO-CTERM domain-containing protein
MRMFRRSVFATAALASLAGGAQLAGCGNSDDSTSPPGIDGGTAVTAGPELTVSDVRAKIYLGQTARIDGTKLAPGITTDIAWTVVNAPFGSAITAASVQDATSASPTFKPDLLGGYTLQISGRKDGVTASVLVFIEAIDAPVFWREAYVKGTQTTLFTESVTTHVGGVHGGGDRAVNCTPDAGGGANALADAGPEGGPDPLALQLLQVGPILSAAGGDVWEAPPGLPSRVVFVDATQVPERLLRTSLSVATSQSACGSSEAKSLETLTYDPGAGAALTAVENTRFSPGGDRIAYVHDIDGKARLSSIGFDGSAKRELAPFYGTGADGGGLDADAGNRAPNFVTPLALTPRWKDETHVGWITFVGQFANTPDRDEWELYLIEDRAGASATRVMHCLGSTPASFDFLPDGTIVAATRHWISTPGIDARPMDLLVYRANATTGECEIGRNLTNNTTDNAVARDLALSPDKSQIAFFAGTGSGDLIDTSGNYLGLFLVNADGSGAVRQIPGTSASGASSGTAPRWAAGGTAITWGGPLLAGVPQQLSVPLTGGVPRLVAATTATQKPDLDGGSSSEIRFVYGIGQGCSVSRGPLSTGFMAAAGALGFGALIARRRRRASRPE